MSGEQQEVERLRRRVAALERVIRERDAEAARPGPAYGEFVVTGGRWGGYRLECWVCDQVLPWLSEAEDACLDVGEMVRIADAHWAAHPDWVAPADAEDRGEEALSGPAATIPIGGWAFDEATVAEARFTGVLAYLAEEQR